jgi:tight adherence protein B
VDCADLRFFITAILLQRETGGNLAEILGKTSTLIRQRFELLGRIQVLAAEGKFSAIILCLLPFVVGFILYTLSPDYISLLFTDSLGNMLAVAAGGLMILGMLCIKITISIKV